MIIVAVALSSLLSVLYMLCILPALMKQPDFELRDRSQVVKVTLDSTGRKATGVIYMDAQGRSVEQPAEPKPFAHKVRIGGYPCEDYLGLVFAYLGEGEPPEFPLYPDWEGKLQTTDFYIRECNYFQHMNNDTAHVPWVHGLRSGDPVPMVTAVETDYGFKSVYQDGRIHLSIFLMPNMSEITSVNIGRPPYDGRGGALFWRVPIDDVTHYNFSCFAFPVELSKGNLIEEANRCVREILAGNLHIEDLRNGDMNLLVNVSDALAQCGQGAIYENWEDENLSRHDNQIVLQRAIWMRELRAFAEGRNAMV